MRQDIGSTCEDADQGEIFQSSAPSTPAMSEARPPQGERNKHHYIPVFYLKGWAGKDGRLCEFSRPYKTPPGQLELNIKSNPVKPRRVYPDGTGFIKRLYRFPGLNSREANYLENEFFLRVDSDAAVVMQRLLQGEVQFDQTSKSAWARFLMSMFHRNPENIRRVAEMVNRDYIKSLPEELRPQNEALREQHGEGPTWDEMIENLTDADYQQSRLLTQQPDQQMASVPAGACLRQSLAAAGGQCEHVIKFAIRQQPAIGGDRRAVEPEHQPGVPDKVRFAPD
jgi:hypothetical protein